MTALSPQQWVTIQNDSGMIIPPRSIVVVTSVTTEAIGGGEELMDISHVDQYGCGKNGNILVTGIEPIFPAGSEVPRNLGIAYTDTLIYVSIDTSISSPKAGEQWGPSDGSWVLTRNSNTVGFFAQGYSVTGGVPDMSMFLRTFARAAATQCSSSSSVSVSSSGSGSKGSGSGSVSGSGSGSGSCACVTVVTSVSCSGGSLSVTYGQAKGCC
jgi:hypothetical protein